MYLIREIMHCKPGKVRPLMEKFRVLSGALEDPGQEPVRLLTDVGGERFWTLIIEVKVEQVEDFFAFEQKLFEDQAVRASMSNYHELVESGRREIYRIEPAAAPVAAGAA